GRQPRQGLEEQLGGDNSGSPRGPAGAAGTQLPGGRGVQGRPGTHPSGGWRALEEHPQPLPAEEAQPRDRGSREGAQPAPGRGRVRGGGVTLASLGAAGGGREAPRRFGRLV
ncbi:MAG: hypothetical protein AVDCRST_MAG78-2818, partial [uncultured Rubrobacteraceae bacterium]